MPSNRIPSQNALTSPTYERSQYPAQTLTVPSSTRRNLFATHVSSRPTTTQGTDPFQAGAGTVPPRRDDGPARRLQPSKLRNSNRNSQDDHEADPTGSRPFVHDPSDPRASQAAGILTLDPQTGRPVLPNIPMLPPRLQLDDNNEDEDDEDDEDGDVDRMRSGTVAAGVATRDFEDDREHTNKSVSQHTSCGRVRDPDYEVDRGWSSLHGSLSQHDATDFMDVSFEESQLDRRRIEGLLREMQAGQRERARDTAFPSDLGPSSLLVPTTATASTRVVAKTRTPAAQGVGLNSPTKARETSESGHGGLGATMDPQEKDEFMVLIMTSLHRRLHQAESEAWMYDNTGCRRTSDLRAGLHDETTFDD